jgi:hypothetical protein
MSLNNNVEQSNKVTPDHAIARDNTLAGAEIGGFAERLNVTPFAELTESDRVVSNVLRKLLEEERHREQPSQLEQELSPALAATIKELAEEKVKPTMNADFHSWQHAQAVAERFSRYLGEAGFSPVVQTLGELAGIFHDAGHPGFRYREDAQDVSYPELSNEEYAAVLAVETLEPYLNTAQLKWLHDAILATSFGQRLGNDPVANQLLTDRPHLIRPYKPETLEQHLMHFADINSTDVEAGFESFVRAGLDLAKEVGQGNAPMPASVAQYESYLASQGQFLKYIEFLGKELASQVSQEASERISGRLADVKQRLDILKNGFEGRDAILVMDIASSVFRAPLVQ